MIEEFEGLDFVQADVFAEGPLSGNGLSVFLDCAQLSASLMQRLSVEMRQFESIFLIPGKDPQCARARIFTMEEELEFAGHPLLGAACVLHDRKGEATALETWCFELTEKSITVETERLAAGFKAVMRQGMPSFGEPLSAERAAPYLKALNLAESDLEPGLPLQMVSTGLPYLLVPIRSGLADVKTLHDDFEGLLAEIGAKFSYVLDVPALEGRTWDNLGLVEDIATGSAAGPVGAYLVRHGRAEVGSEIILSQGRFVGRPSKLTIKVLATQNHIEDVHVGGGVHIVARGRFGR